MNAMIAALYAALTLAISPIAYGSVQMRLSEVMVLLAFYNRKFIPGLTLGCLVANLASPLGAWDLVFGTLATLLATLSFAKLPRLWMCAVAGSVWNGLIVGLELTLVFTTPFAVNALSVAAGEVVVLFIGCVMFQLAERRDALRLIKSV